MNGVSWSLSCEAFFYAMFPFMIVLLVRAPSWAIRVTLAAAVTGVLLYPSVATAHLVIGTLHITYMSPLIRALEFICGIALALEVRRGRWPRVPLWLAWPLAAVGYLLAGQAGLWYGSGAWFTIYYSFVAATIVPFVILIGAYATRDVAGGRSLFRSRTAIRLGEWSYSFYLVHFLVITVFLHATDNWRPGGVPAAALATAFLLVVALACAAALYHFVERPCEKRIRGSLRTPTAELVARDALAHSPS
jgi:peptidoglycan/LPS O-acetylase OafA/YrhL